MPPICARKSFFTSFYDVVKNCLLIVLDPLLLFWVNGIMLLFFDNRDGCR
ncbi:hypothetical protein B4113_2280 [Geobacillus sp. B4113_201601]|nr:hypothetical protein B4113_2280 [Geobacillus sp. B4113_201601]